MLAFLGLVMATLNAAHAQAPAQAPAATTPAPTPPIVIDDFSDVSKWQVVASDGVEGKVSLAEGTTCPDDTDAKALRLDFDFKKGSGYCIVRREMDLVVPENYRVGFWLVGSTGLIGSDGKATGFVNDLEFKFYDQTGDNVWWVRTPNNRYTPTWSRLRYVKRQLDFAWGPGGGKVPLERVKAIEFAVTVGNGSEGGKGYIMLDRLTLEPLGVSARAPGSAAIFVNGSPAGELVNGEAKNITLPAVMSEGKARETRALTLDFGGPSEFGGLLIEWDGNYDPWSMAASTNLFPGPPEAWLDGETVGTREPTIHVYPGVEASRADIVFKAKDDQPRTIRRLSLLPRDAGTNLNTVVRLIASISPRGWYPRQFLGEQMSWAVFGALGREYEGLLGSDGQVELEKGGYSLEPFLQVEDRLLSWADFNATHDLRLSLPTPRPMVTLTAADGLTLYVLPRAPHDHAVVQYTLVNNGQTRVSTRLWLTLRGFQVLPMWHTLNIVGGVAYDGGTLPTATTTLTSMRLGDWRVNTERPADELVFDWSTLHDVVSLISAGTKNPAADFANSGAMGFDMTLAPGESKSLWVRAGKGLNAGTPVDGKELSIEGVTDWVEWEMDPNRVRLVLPTMASALQDSFYAQIGWILVNKDGPAIQPGSRTYDRTWIRDGALTATALLYTGHADEVKEFLDWFRTFQYEDGKVPCCVDERGPDPVPEHDSHGQYIYGVATYHRFTHDDDLLKRHWGNVAAAVGYIEKLRATRMTAEFSDPNAPAETRVKFGLVPESISHEGYSAKPMHSYWDDFFTLRGLTDAVYIAEKLGENEQAAKWATLRDDFQRTLVDSIRLAQRIKNITFVPGCAELGDYDPTSTAAAIFPGSQTDGPLGDSLRATFDRYIAWFRDRRDGRIEWRDYTPYEMRNASALLLLGHADQSHEVLDWMLSERASIGWREWAEIGYKDKKAGKFVGDMPHTWVGSDYVKAVRNLCVYERERDHALVVGAGLKPEWLQAEGGVTVGGFPTEFGTLSYTASMKDGVVEFDIEVGTVKMPPGGIVVMPMMTGKMGTVTINGEPAKETGDGFVTVRALPAKVRIDVK